MLRHALLRLAASIPTLLVLATLTFFLLRAAPGGPFDEERVLPPDVQANLERTYHLDEPLWEQFGRYLGGVLTGDLGASFQYTDATVSHLIGEGAPVSFTIGSLALVLALLVGGAAGIGAAVRRGRLGDPVLKTWADRG
jgi:oligopeptide transport system permease protein